MSTAAHYNGGTLTGTLDYDPATRCDPPSPATSYSHNFAGSPYLDDLEAPHYLPPVDEKQRVAGVRL